MAELGAQICLDAGDLTRMEHYLAIAEATEPFNTRKCDRGFSLNSVREFRVDHGLLDPADAIGEEERIKAGFEWAARQYKQAITSGERESAKAVIDGPVAAELLLKHAMTDAETEKRSDFRRGAINAALDLKANIGRLEDAIDDARKLRSPTQRRKTLATLLAKAKRWGELRKVLSQVESPEEAADVVWWIKFELPGGEAR
jgi:hypothetical protein